MYDNRRTRFIFPQFDFGGGADGLRRFHLPKGKSGLIMDVGVFDVTEVFNGGTLMPGIRIGTEADDDAYMDDWLLGAVTVASGGKSALGTYDAGDAAFAALFVDRKIVKDVAVRVTLLAATGSGLTGIATAFVDVAIDN